MTEPAEPPPRGVRGSTEGSALRGQATAALRINLVVAVFCFGLMSIPGAVAAGMALGAIEHEPRRAARLLRWSWAFLATNLLFYLLLVALVVALLVFVLSASRSGS